MLNSSLTGFDWQLLEFLQGNGRITISELSKRLGRSRGTISEHLEKLQDNGILSGFSIDIDEEKMGFGVSAFVRVQAASNKHRQIINKLNDMPEVAECHVLTGADLVIVRLVARNMPHLRDLVDRLTQYGSTQTDVIFSTTKNKLKINKELRASTEL